MGPGRGENRQVLIACLQLVVLAVVILGTVLEAKRVCGPNQFRCRNGKTCVAGKTEIRLG